MVVATTMATPPLLLWSIRRSGRLAAAAVAAREGAAAVVGRSE
jgi:hypothetical protein